VSNEAFSLAMRKVLGRQLDFRIFEDVLEIPPRTCNRLWEENLQLGIQWNDGGVHKYCIVPQYY